MLIVYRARNEPGWHPITAMVRLAARLLEAEVCVVDVFESPSQIQKFTTALPRRRGNDACLVICPEPPDLDALLLVRGWRSRFNRVAAWVIDSFWTGRIPAIARYGRAYDQFYVTGEEEIPEWQRATSRPTAWLPWGADALGFAATKADRSIDLLRTGRQPPEWDDDASTATACRDAGLTFQGRPGVFGDADVNQRELMAGYSGTKFSLAFSNLVSPAHNTHPTRDYITARWTDALAAGAVVAGIVPRARSARNLLWPGATLELGTVSREQGLQVLREAVRAWHPEQAVLNRWRALERLDWRWRFETLAKYLGEIPSALGAELTALREMIALGRLY